MAESLNQRTLSEPSGEAFENGIDRLLQEVVRTNEYKKTTGRDLFRVEKQVKREAGIGNPSMNGGGQ